MEAEDLAEQENKELATRLESVESIVRMLELKHKNSLEHASRLEEREADLKKVNPNNFKSHSTDGKCFACVSNQLRSITNCTSGTQSCSRTMWTTWSAPRC